MTYTFECRKCDKHKSVEIRMSDYDKEKNNQKCSCGEKMFRVFEPVGLTVYNCDGFYDTDSRNVKGR